MPEIERKLRLRMTVSHLEIIDQSDQHAGHNPAAARGGTHFKVLVVSPDFDGKSLIERHRLVNDAVLEDGPGTIHALVIKAMTPAEWNAKRA